MVKVGLVNPHKFNLPSTLQSIKTVMIRRALAIFSSILKERGHDVILFDLRMMSGWDDFKNRLKQASVDFLGVTVLTRDHDIAMKCFEIAKNIDKNIITVAGGMQPTMFPELFADSGFVDYVVKGEGDVSFPKLIENPSEFPKVFWGETPVLDSLPFEDRELWPDYKTRVQGSWWGLSVPIIDVFIKRGCPWRCKFCVGPGEQNLYTSERKDGSRGYKFKTRSVEHVIQELVQLYNKWHFKTIIISDGEFLINPKWVLKFCQRMKEVGFVEKGIKWWAAVRADVICQFEYVVEEMKKAGFDMVSIGFESFSPRILKWMDKGTTVEQYWRAVEICKRLKIKIFGNFMFGLPYSDGKWYRNDDIITFNAITKMKPDVCATSYFQPIPGSRFYKWFIDNDLVVDDSFSVYQTEGIGNIRGVDYVFLEELRRMITPPPPPYRRILNAILRRFPIDINDILRKIKKKANK